MSHHNKISATEEQSESTTTQKKVETNGATPSWPKLAAGVSAAGGASLLAVGVFGLGPAAIAGAAGYLAYRGMKK